MKLNGIQFQNQCIRIEKAHRTKPTQGVPLNKQNRPNPTVMPRENVLILSDSVVNFNRKIKCKISKGLQSGRARFIYFPGATSKDLLHYIYTICYIYYIFALYIYTIYYHSFEVAIIRIGVSFISNRNSPDFDLVLKNIQKYRSYDIENIFISGLLQKTCYRRCY